MKIAVSGCLLGENIRHNGGHKRDRFITDALGHYAEFISFCPEHLAFGTPRDSIRLVNDPDGIIVQNNKSAEDLTEALTNASEEELGKIDEHPLCGIILKSKSPSCGLGSAVLYRLNGYAEKKGSGIFAQMCQKKFPLLPIEEEGRLQDPWLRENFIMQLFAYHDFETFKASQPTMKALVAFHQSYKFMLQSKDDQSYRELGNIAANRYGHTFEELLAAYETRFKETIGHKSSIGKTRNVLEHMAGFLKKEMSEVEKRTLHEQIEDYANKIVPLITPLSTLHMLAKEYQVSYLLGQKFLHPYPKALALRSDIRSGK
ncbi:MAG: YbgA family protein [Sulfurovum sp.]